MRTHVLRLLSHRAFPWVIVVTGVLLRLLALSLIAHQPLMSDAGNYAGMAAALRSGVPFIPYWPPGVPLYVAFMQMVFGSSVLVLRVTMIVFYLGCSFFLYRASVTFTGGRIAGSVALLLLAVSPASIAASIETTTELPTAMLLAAVAFCLIDSRMRLTPPKVALLGLSLGLLCLTRPSNLVLLAAIPAYLWWRQRRLTPGLGVLFLGGATVLAWVVYVHAETGRFIKINTANARNFYLGNNPATPLYRTWWLGSHHELDASLNQTFADVHDPIALDREYSRRAMAHIRQRPDLFLLRTFNRICVFFVFNPYTGAYWMGSYGLPHFAGFAVIAADAGLYFVLAVGTLLYLCQRNPPQQRAEIPVLLSLCLLMSLPYFFAFSHPRYRFPVEMIFMVFSAAFLESRLHAQAEERVVVPSSVRAVFVTLLLCFAAVQLEFLILVERVRS